MSTLIGPSLAALPAPQVISQFACDEPVTTIYPNDPASYSAYVRQDLSNQACASQRLEDQFDNDELHNKYLSMGPPAYQANLASQLAEPTRPRITAARLLPFAGLGDPFRAAEAWQTAGRGRVHPVQFVSANTGAHLAGEIWLPPTSIAGPYPAVIIGTGGAQQFRASYRWAAEGLAEEGYMTFTYDVQAQGDSENWDHNGDGSICAFNATCGKHLVPPDSYGDGSFFEDTMRDAIRFLFSTPSTAYGISSPNYSGTNLYNPDWAVLNTDQVGIAGHSLSGGAAINIGQQDQRIRAIVKWDADGQTRGEVVPLIHAPTLELNSDYGAKSPQPFLLNPAPSAKQVGYRQLVALGIDTMQVSLRAATHYDFTYVPGRSASRYGERVAFYYTLAWMDDYLKGRSDTSKKTSGFDRLAGHVFDDSSDVHSIGAGTYGPDVNGTYRNVPYKITGTAVSTRLSYIYPSLYWLKGGAANCSDMKYC